MVNPFIWLIGQVIWIYIYIVFAWVILSWLIALNVVNSRNDFVNNIGNFLHRITEPALKPIRDRLPNLGGIDISPMVLILGLVFLDYLVKWVYFKIAYGL
jgi:YggT family protein